MTDPPLDAPTPWELWELAQREVVEQVRRRYIQLMKEYGWID